MVSRSGGDSLRWIILILFVAACGFACVKRPEKHGEELRVEEEKIWEVALNGLCLPVYEENQMAGIAIPGGDAGAGSRFSYRIATALPLVAMVFPWSDVVDELEQAGIEERVAEPMVAQLRAMRRKRQVGPVLQKVACSRDSDGRGREALVRVSRAVVSPAGDALVGVEMSIDTSFMRFILLLKKEGATWRPVKRVGLGTT